MGAGTAVPGFCCCIRYSEVHQYCILLYYTILCIPSILHYTVSVLGRDEGYTVKYTPSPEGVSEGEAQGNS